MGSLHRKGGGENGKPDLPNRADALEAADNGHTQELAMWREIHAIGATQIPERKPVDHATATKVGTKLLDAQKAVMEAALALPLDGYGDFHLGLNGLVNEIERITGELADRWGSE